MSDDSRKKSSPRSRLAVLCIPWLAVVLTAAAHQLPTQTKPHTPTTNSPSQIIEPATRQTLAPSGGDTSRQDTATVNQICSSQRARGSSLCKPCRCNPNGSTSRHCDTYTRRCSCQPGYTGNTCNKCSEGYRKPQVNNNQSVPNGAANAAAIIDQYQLEDSRTIGEVSCVACDDCYRQKRKLTSELKLGAGKLIERAHELDRRYIDQIGVAEPVNQSRPQLSLAGDRITFSDIDQILSKLGERLLDNKQKSDRLSLLSYELDRINDSHEPIAASIKALDNQTGELDIGLVRLQRKLKLQFESVHNLTSNLARIQLELTHVQDHVPQVAPRLFERNRNRTQRAMREARELDQNSSLAVRIDELDLMKDKIEFSKRQLDIIGANILANYIGNRQPHGELAAYDSIRVSSRELESLPNSTLNLESTARLFAELSLNFSGSYLSQYDMRIAELKSIREDIDAANASLLSSGQLLVIDRDPIDSLVGFRLLLKNSAEANRDRLSKIGAMERSTMVDLVELRSKLGDFAASRAVNITVNINTIISMNSSKFESFRNSIPRKDLNELTGLRAKLSSLNEDLVKLKHAQQNLVDIKNEVAQKTQRTEALITEIRSTILWVLDRDSTMNSIDSGVAAESRVASDELLNHSDSLSSVTQSLVSRSRELLDRISVFQARQVSHEMSLGRRTTDTQNATTAGTPASTGARDKLTSLWRRLAELGDQGEGDAAPSLETNRLSNKRRLVTLMDDAKQLSLTFREGSTVANGLAGDFASLRREFADQRKRIDELHDQMDSIISDLEQRLDSHDDCPTTN